MPAAPWSPIIWQTVIIIIEKQWKIIIPSLKSYDIFSNRRETIAPLIPSLTPLLLRKFKKINAVEDQQVDDNGVAVTSEPISMFEYKKNKNKNEKDVS